MEDYRLEQTGQEVQRILNGAAMDANLQAEVERATDAEGTLQDNIDAEEQARQDADGLLQQAVDDEEQRAKDAEEANAGEIEGIKALIPATATSANKLADTNYVNSSIQTATAEYRGDYNVVTDLHLAIDATHAQIETLLPTVIAEADKNDYCYVMIPTNASTPTEIAKIERYKMTSEGWKFEYDVNNSTFTAEEWAAIKSGITSGLVAKLNSLPTNSDLLLLLAAKQDVLTFDSVPVPESNNPVKSGGVYSAIDDEKTARLNSDTAIHTELDGLQAKVPATASSDNKLVDQNQMNSSISTATATFRGDWNVVSDLHLAVDATRAQIAALLPTVISTADNNDYCYVEIPTSVETPTQIERVERYKYNGTAWGYEYVLNNSGFTADQWAAINSMITSGLVAKLSALPTNADLLAMLAQKQDNLTFDTTPTENSTNPVTSGGVFAADKALSDAIEAILLLIPSAASSLNKLVDTALMNSSISTATATFRGTYNLVSDLGLGIDATEGQIAAALSTAISTSDNNDYAFVQIPTSAETPAQIARTDRYKFNGTAWGFEYTLNTSGFTAAQWAAINSTITSALVAKLNALPTASELQEALGVITSGITAINQKIPSTASQSNKLVDNASMESYITQVINILDASFNVTSTDGHITLHITQVDGVITSVQVQSTDIASAADLALKASQADLTALASRVSTAEGNITSLTGRMGTAETNIANLQQLYNNLQQSKPVPVTALPSTGQQLGVIYRLAGTTSYSDYMWNGSSWVLMATYNNAIDTQPIAGSDNLVTSDGVFERIAKASGFCLLNEDAVLSQNSAFGAYYYTGKLLTADSVNEGDTVFFRFKSVVGSAAHIYFYDNMNVLIQSFGNNVAQSVKTTTNKFKIPANFGYAYFEQTLNPTSGSAHFDYLYTDKSNIKLYEDNQDLRNFIEQSSGLYLREKEMAMALNADFGQYYYSEKVITKDSVNVGDIIKFKFKNAAGNSAFIYFCDESGTLLNSFGSNISQSVITTEDVYTIPSGFGFAYFVQGNSTGKVYCDYLWKDYSNFELLELIGTISGQVDVCLPTDDLQQYVNTHRQVNLTSGVYNISTPIVIPSNTKIGGIRGESIIKGSGNLFDISGKSNIQIENITFEGSGAVTRQAVQLADLRAKTGFTNTNSGIIATSHAENCNIVNCEFKNFASCGIYLDHTMASTSEIARNVNIDKCQFYNNYCGIRLGVRAEFHNISNCEINFNTVGVMVEGGNNTVVACHIDLNGIGFCVSGTAGNNDSHGKIADCSMNHSSGYAVACVDVNNGYTFSNCHAFDGVGIMISNSIGIAYNGGMIGCKIVIDTPRSAGFNMVNDVMFGDPSAYDTGVIEGDTTRLSLKNNRYSVQDDSTGINNTN